MLRILSNLSAAFKHHYADFEDELLKISGQVQK